MSPLFQPGSIITVFQVSMPFSHSTNFCSCLIPLEFLILIYVTTKCLLSWPPQYFLSLFLCLSLRSQCFLARLLTFFFFLTFCLLSSPIHAPYCSIVFITCHTNHTISLLKRNSLRSFALLKLCDHLYCLGYLFWCSITCFLILSLNFSLSVIYSVINSTYPLNTYDMPHTMLNPGGYKD